LQNLSKKSVKVRKQRLKKESEKIICPNPSATKIDAYNFYVRRKIATFAGKKDGGADA
jgi:hypothetical protein